MSANAQVAARIQKPDLLNFRDLGDASARVRKGAVFWMSWSCLRAFLLGECRHCAHVR
jgi:hypothetical protein